MGFIDRDAALAQLLATNAFASAARSRALLSFLAERAWTAGDANVNEIVIALDHLGRDASTFDPKTDSVVRVELSRLRKRLDAVFEAELVDAPWRISLPSGRYAPVFTARETTAPQPSSGVMRPATDVVPPPLPSPDIQVAPESASSARAHPVVSAPAASSEVARTWWQRWATLQKLAAFGGAFALVAAGGWWMSRAVSDHVDPGDVIAVLPFACSSDAAEDLFCDGLADEVLDRLVQVPELKVIARTSSFKFKGKNVDARDAGKQLGAKYLVEGSLQREADNYKLVAQMVRASDGAHVVSRVFRRTGTERLKLQSDLAALVADALALNLRPTFAHAKTDREQLSPEAQAKWNKAFHLVGGGNEADQQAAMVLLDDVIAAHPTFARAWSTKASLIRNRAYFGENVDVAAAKAMPVMRKAAELAPDDPAIQAKLAFLEFMNRTDIRVAYGKLKTLAERNPNHSGVIYWWGTVLWLTGRLPEAAEAYRQSYILSPLDVSSLHMRARMLQMMGGRDNLAEAMRVTQSALTMDPKFTDMYRVRGQVKLAQGDYPGGKADLLRGIAPLGPVSNELTNAYFAFVEGRESGKPIDVVAIRAAVVARYGAGAMPWAASSALATGHNEEAIVWCQRAVSAGQEGAQHLAHELHDSAFLAIRDDPRMQMVYDHIGSSWARLRTTPKGAAVTLRN